MALTALPFFCAFEHYSDSDQIVAAGSFDNYTNTLGTELVDISGIRRLHADTVGINLDTTYSQVVVGFRHYGYTVAAASSETLIAAYASASRGINLHRNGGVLQVRNDTTVLDSVSLQIADSTDKYIEFAFTISPTAGTYEVRVDGVNVLSGTNANTGSAAADQINFLDDTATSNGCNFTYGYIKAWDSGSDPGFYGSIEMVDLTPNADQGTNEWDTSAGADHYAMVDERPTDEATTYLQTDVDNEVERLELDVSGIDSEDSIIALMPFAIANAPNGGSVGLELGGSDGTDEYGPERTIGTSTDRGYWGEAITDLPTGAGAITPANVGTVDLIMRSSI